MDIEQLKLVLETIGGAADGAKAFAMWWLILGFVKGLAVIAGWIVVFGIMGRTVKYCCELISKCQ